MTSVKTSDLYHMSSAEFSPCRRWRYTLWRWWDTGKDFTMVIGLNPSTADEMNDDPTVRRCIRFAHDWGYGGLCMTNIFAIRATNPKVMLAHPEPVGPENDSYLQDVSQKAGIIIAAWGVHGKHLGRGDAVAQMIPNLRCLGITKEGRPRHPLYLRADSKPIPFSSD